MALETTSSPYRNYEPYEPDTETARDVYRERIQQNPEVCSNCLTHIRDVVLPHSEKKEIAKGLVRWYEAKPDRTNRANVPETSSARNPPRCCANCGSIRSTTRRPLQYDRAVEYTWNLSRTLLDLEVEHNPLVLAFVVAHRKRFPRFGSNDDDTYQVALEYALPSTTGSIDAVLRPGLADPARIDTDPRVDHPALPRGTGRRREGVATRTALPPDEPDR